jgi:hypothetical protein
MAIPINFDITFKILQFVPEDDIFVIQCHSSILKNSIESYPSINLGTRNINLQGDVKEQILTQCRGLIEMWYKEENKDPEKEQNGIDFIKENLEKTITVDASETNENLVIPSPMSKIRFI